MRIAFYLNYLWGVGSGPKIAEMLARKFKKRGHEVFFIIQKDLVERANEFPIILLKEKNEITRAYELGKVLKEINADICFGFMRPMSVVMGITKLLYPSHKTLFIGSIHNNDNYIKYGKALYIPYRVLLKFVLEMLDGIVAVSRGVKEDIERTYFIKKKVRVFYNPVDVENLIELSREEIPEEEERIFEKPVIINLSRFVKQKGLPHLIRIFKKVSEELDARLVILGDGEMREEVEKMIRDLKLEDSVFLLGWKKNPYPYIRRAKVLAMTSLWEGYGLVLNEAMALGTPPVAFNVKGGPSEILPGCCPLIDYPDEETYAREVIKLLTDKEYYETIKQNAIKKASEFSVEKVADRLLKYFEELIEERKR
ncbi:glycosyltransferase [Aquifex pyrophilus]